MIDAHYGVGNEPSSCQEPDFVRRHRCCAAINRITLAKLYAGPEPWAKKPGRICAKPVRTNQISDFAALRSESQTEPHNLGSFSCVGQCPNGDCSRGGAIFD